MYLAAEVAQAHEGKLEVALAYVDALAATGVDAVKFQVHIAEAESSLLEPYRPGVLQKDATRFDYWKRTGFTLEEWKWLKRRCEEMGVEFLASPFSNAAVDLLEEVGVQRYKVGSGEVNNFLLLEKIARTGKPLILSSGMSNFEELDQAVAFLRKRNVRFAILQCSSVYPNKPQHYGLNVIQELKQRYKIPVGYSDHSAHMGTSIAAVALGAEILEVHAIFNRRSAQPDASSSLEISEIAQLVKEVRKLKTALVNPVDKTNNTSFSELKNIFEKSLSVNKHLPEGHVLGFEDLEAKKPRGQGFDASRFEEVIMRKLRNQKSQWDILTEEDLYEA